VIVVMVSDEDSSDISDIEPRLRNAAYDAVAGVNDIQPAIDDQKIGRLRSVRSWRRTSYGPKGDQTGIRSLRSGARCLRHTFVHKHTGDD
jgi:hypothetical protein